MRRHRVESPRKKRVLFVCIGNVCRSPMAEAMARKYGSDVIEPTSAGLSPAPGVQSLTRDVLVEKNIDLGNHVPKPFRDIDLSGVDMIVNLSGGNLNARLPVPVETWPVADPFGFDHEIYREAREEIERRVMNLVLRIRAGKI